MSTELKWLLVGTGDIAAKRVAPALSSVSGSRLVAVCSRSVDRARAFASPYRARACDDFESAVRSDDVDAVYIATPVHLHVAQAIAAMTARKHVLVEKPLGLSAEDAARAAVAAREHPSLVCGCAYYRRCSSRFAHASELLRSGRLGRILLVRMIYHAWFDPERHDPKYWRVVRSMSGGGALADIGCHMFDVLLGLLGMPRTIFGKSARLLHHCDVEDISSVLMEMTDGAQVTGSFLWNSRTWAHEFEIIGSEGKLRWTPFDTGEVQLTIGRETTRIDLPPAPNVHAPLVEDFVDAVRQRRPPVAPLSQAVLTNRMIDAIYASAAGGAEVRL